MRTRRTEQARGRKKRRSFYSLQQRAQARILSPIVSSSHLLAKNAGELIRAFAGVPKGNHCKGIQIAPLGLFLVRSKNSPSASAFSKGLRKIRCHAGVFWYGPYSPAVLVGS